MKGRTSANSTARLPALHVTTLTNSFGRCCCALLYTSGPLHATGVSACARNSAQQPRLQLFARPVTWTTEESIGHARILLNVTVRICDIHRSSLATIAIETSARGRMNERKQVHATSVLNHTQRGTDTPPIKGVQNTT